MTLLKVSKILQQNVFTQLEKAFSQYFKELDEKTLEKLSSGIAYSRDRTGKPLWDFIDGSLERNDIFVYLPCTEAEIADVKSLKGHNARTKSGQLFADFTQISRSALPLKTVSFPLLQGANLDLIPGKKVDIEAWLVQDYNQTANPKVVNRLEIFLKVA